MEPVSLILKALVAGAQTATTDVASSTIKSGYNKLKSLIQQKWVGKPDAETVLTGYKDEPEAWESLLKKRLKESGISEDQEVFQVAKHLLQEVNPSVSVADSQVAINSNKQKAVDLSRKDSSGDTVAYGASLDKSSRTVGKGNYYEGAYTQVDNRRQTRLAALLWLLALALTGVIGFGVYLFMAGRLQLPGQPALPERRINSEQLPTVPEQRVSLAALDSIQGGMTFAQVEEKLGVHLKLYSEVSYANTPFSSMYESQMNIKSEAIYSCVLEDGSSFYFGFIQTAQPDRLVLVRKATTPDLKTPGSSN